MNQNAQGYEMESCRRRWWAIGRCRQEKCIIIVDQRSFFLVSEWGLRHCLGNCTRIAVLDLNRDEMQFIVLTPRIIWDISMYGSWAYTSPAHVESVFMDGWGLWIFWFPQHIYNILYYSTLILCSWSTSWYPCCISFKIVILGSLLLRYGCNCRARQSGS